MLSLDKEIVFVYNISSGDGEVPLPVLLWLFVEEITDYDEQCAHD